MGIMILFSRPEPRGLRGDAHLDVGSAGRQPPAFSMPLPRAPTGPVSRESLDLGRRLPLRRRADLAPPRHDLHLALHGPVQHDVTVVGGPMGFSAPWTLAGTFTHRFTKTGVYRLFCSLHPAMMVQQITVR